MDFIRAVGKLHREATHNVYAYRISEDQEKCSDDGEPSGTAGRPVLNVIRGENLLRVALVVTRYYGGVLLGAGGLVRAYSQTSTLGIAEAGLVTRRLAQAFTVQFDLNLFGRVKKAIEKSGANIIEVLVTDRALIRAQILLEEFEVLAAKLVELSSGRANINKLDQEYI
ncbi:hypothetical protein N752_03125 [Desulforamulus aquiferis]|nr:YigZ family protein [Desulforamulus aquiferis]RYD06680.1 hypothetical protein N752_03125 [Desulforamulus aquiferis]